LLVFQAAFQDQFYIKLAERLINLEPGIEAYLNRVPFIQNLCLIDGQGEQLDFELTTYPHVLYMGTSLGDFGMVFGDNQTLIIGLPPNVQAGIKFHVTPQFWKILESGGEFKSVRDMFYATNGEVVRNLITADRGGYTVEFIVKSDLDATIAIRIADRTPLHEIEPFSVYYDRSEMLWQEWFDRIPMVAERFRKVYSYAWWVMANNLITPKGSVRFESMVPSKVNYVGLWLWDSAMHTLAYRHVNPDLARNQIRSMISVQLEDGMLPDAVYDEGVVTEIDHPIRAVVTKPPILAWAAMKLHETAPDLDFLKEIYIPLVRWNAWWFTMNDDDVDGLAQYNHPYSSGLDNNPLWDYGMPVESPDLNTYLCVQMGSLAMMAERLGMDAEGAMWRRRASAIVDRMIHHFWDDYTGIFRATVNHEPVPVMTPFNLYPLWTGQLPVNIRDRILGHLQNPEEFWGETMIPTVAKNDPHYDPEEMWRGPAWANVNYFMIEALEQIGKHKLAVDLREKTLQMIMNQPGLHEYYNSQTGEAARKAAEGFGWTAAVFIDLAIAASREESEGA
jgi:putative isomerase